MSQHTVRRGVSIRGTIVVLVTCATVLLLTGYALFLYKVFESYQRLEHARFLRSKLHYIRSEIQSSTEGDDSETEELDEVREVIDLENATRRSGKVLVDVRTVDGQTLMRVGGSEKFFAFSPPFPPPAERIASAALRYWEAPTGRHFVLSSVAFKNGPDVRIVRVALDWSAEEDLIEDFSRKAAAALLLGTILSSFLAATIAHRALRPLAQVAQVARAMDVARLAEPLDVGIWPAELAEVGAAFTEMQQRLSASFNHLSQFSADLAHELRTPISNAMGEAEVALSRARTADDYREVIASLHEELGRLARMADALLFLDRSEKGAAALNRSTFDGRAESLAVAEYHALAAEEKQIELSVDGAATVFADRDLFRRALSNLMANAIHYTPGPGSVTVTLYESSDHAEVRVRDTGAGIAAKNQAQIFDRFFRVDPARSGYAGGSGLGLAIVKSIVELHGGSVTVASTPGEGALFTLTFPSAAQITKM